MKKFRKTKQTKEKWYEKKYDAKTLAKKALQGVWQLRGLVNSEMKYNIQNNTSLYPDYNGTITCLNLIAQGDSATTRDGNSIYVRSLHLRLQLTIHASATTTRIRVMVLYDTWNQGVDPAVGNVLENTALGTVNAPMSVLHPIYARRFHLLHSKIYQLTSVARTELPVNLYWKLRHHIKYKGVNSTDNQNGSIYMLLICNEQTNTPTVSFLSKLSYHDN